MSLHFFSCLLPIYLKDDPSFLDTAFESVFNQTIMPGEVVLVQDGPITEELAEVVMKWKKKLPINHIVHSKNLGLGRSLSLGLLQCKGDLVARMDADDICHPARFEKQVRYLQKHPDIDVVGSWIAEFEGEVDNVVSRRVLPESHEDLLPFAKKRCPLNHPTVVYRKKSILAVGNYDKFKNQQDYHLWVRLLNAGYKIANIPEPLLYMRISSALFQRRGGWKYFMIEWNVQRDFLKMGFINLFEFVRNVTLRGIVRLAPNLIRKKIYQKGLR
jgi:glycosyltransferase involved in cell wall biosynthesis